MNDKIKELECKIEDMKSKFETSVGVLISEIGKLKKSEEVNPVFPNRDNCKSHVWGIANNVILPFPESYTDNWIDESSKLGMTFYSEREVYDDIDRKKAQAYVIEEINKANKGDNGFKVGISNYLLEYYHTLSVFSCEKYTYTQSNDDYEYIRSREAAKKLLKNDKFVDAYKLMKGIKAGG